MKRIRPNSDRYKSYNCFVTAKTCAGKGEWLSTLSTPEEGIPSERFFQALSSGCTKGAPEPTQISLDEFKEYMNTSPFSNRDAILNAVSEGPCFRHERGVVVIEKLPAWMIPEHDEVRQDCCILSALVSDPSADSWGGEYLFSFAVAHARRQKWKKMFFQPEPTIPLRVWGMWCERENLTLEHNKLKYIYKLLDGEFNNQYGLYPLVTMYLKDGTKKTLSGSKDPGFKIQHESGETILTVEQAKTYVKNNWNETFACTPTMDESGYFVYSDGQRAENTFWVNLN